jgi:hypothetical protein
MAARLEEKRNANWVLVEKTEEKNHLENLGVDGSKTLKWHVNKKVWIAGTEFIWLGIFGSGGPL